MEGRGGGCDATAKWLWAILAVAVLTTALVVRCRRRPRAPRSATSATTPARVRPSGECRHRALQGPHLLGQLGSARLRSSRPRPCAPGSRSARRPGSRSTARSQHVPITAGLRLPGRNWARARLRGLYRTGTETPNNLAHRPGLMERWWHRGLHRRVPDRAAGDLSRPDVHRTPTSTKPVTLAGLVVADAEATNNTTVRSTCARSPSNGSGRVADHRRLRRYVRHQPTRLSQALHPGRHRQRSSG